MHIKISEVSITLLSFVTVIAGYIPLIILKLPRSGSSWFVGELNEIPGVFIKKEILHHDDIHRYSSDRIEDYLISALQLPVNKEVLDPNDSFKDTIHVKSIVDSEQIQVVGFSLNLEHVPGINFDHILNEIPRVVVIVLTRSNIVKSAVSM